MTEKICYNMEDLYQILPIGRNKLYELVNRPGFPRIVVGRRILVPKLQFEEWLAKSAASQASFQ